MTQKEANQKAKELYDEWNFKHDEIERRAKKMVSGRRWDWTLTEIYLKNCGKKH